MDLCLDDLFLLQVLLRTILTACTQTTTATCLVQTTSGNCLTGPPFSKHWRHSWTDRYSPLFWVASRFLRAFSLTLSHLSWHWMLIKRDRVPPLLRWDPVPSQALPLSSWDQLHNIPELTPSSQITFHVHAASLVLLFKQHRWATQPVVSIEVSPLLFIFSISS